MSDNIDINDLKLDENGVVRTSKGKFVKGVSGNMKGRPKKVKPEVIKAQVEEMSAIDPTIFGSEAKKALEYLLSTAKNRTEVKQLATILAPYQTPKKASIETTIKDFTRIEFRMIAPDTMTELESIYKRDPKLIEHLDTQQLDAISHGDPIIIDNIIEAKNDGLVEKPSEE